MYPYVIARFSMHEANHGLEYFLEGSYYYLIETGVVVLFTPLLNNILLPCVPSASIKRRIGVGIFFLLLSTALATIINWRIGPHTHSSLKLFWITMPFVLMGIGDALVFISGV